MTADEERRLLQSIAFNSFIIGRIAALLHLRIETHETRDSTTVTVFEPDGVTVLGSYSVSKPRSHE